MDEEAASASPVIAPLCKALSRRARTGDGSRRLTGSVQALGSRGTPGPARPGSEWRCCSLRAVAAAGSSRDPWSTPRPWSSSAEVCPSSRRDVNCWCSSGAWTAPSSSVSGGAFLALLASVPEESFDPPLLTLFVRTTDLIYQTYQWCMLPLRGPVGGKSCAVPPSPVTITKVSGRDSSDIERARGSWGFWSLEGRS